MLLAAGQPTTRRAILVGGVYALLCLAGLGFTFAPVADWWRWLNPGRPAVMLYYLVGFPGAMVGSDEWTRAIQGVVQGVASHQDVVISLGMALVQVGLIWLMVWQWLKRRRS
jgi:hypothetical protein